MRAVIAGLLAAALLGFWASGVELSAQWTSTLTWTGGLAQPSSRLTLHLAGPLWELTSTLSWGTALQSEHTLILRTSLGQLNVIAGGTVVTQLQGAGGIARQGLWTLSSESLQWKQAFLTLELQLGALKLQLTLVRSAEP